MIADMEVQRGRSVAGKELLHRMEQLYHSLTGAHCSSAIPNG